MSRVCRYLLCAQVLFLSACLRYVPPREEVAKTSSSVAIAGEDEFYAYEKALQKRLEKVIQARASGRASMAATPSAYQIGPGDLIDVRVFDSPDLNTASRVGPDGSLNLPLVVAVRAAGQTQAELQSLVSSQLRNYVRNPQVSVAIVEYESSKVSVIGEVARPGMYPLKRRDYTLTELLSEAGGRTERASGRIVLIPAESSTGPQDASAAGRSPGIEIDIEQLVGGAESRPLLIPLRPGDTIIVPEAGTFQVDGEVEKPGSYPLSSRMSAMGAIASAGGLTYSADVNRVEVIRDVGAGKKAAVTLDLEDVALKGGNDVRLRDGDYVRVPSAPSRFGTRQVVEVLNGFFRMGLR